MNTYGHTMKTFQSSHRSFDLVLGEANVTPLKKANWFGRLKQNEFRDK